MIIVLLVNHFLIIVSSQIKPEETGAMQDIKAEIQSVKGLLLSRWHYIFSLISSIILIISLIHFDLNQTGNFYIKSQPNSFDCSQFAALCLKIPPPSQLGEAHLSQEEVHSKMGLFHLLNYYSPSKFGIVSKPRVTWISLSISVWAHLYIMPPSYWTNIIVILIILQPVISTKSQQITTHNPCLATWSWRV